ncbi:MAG: hypothetical protein J2P31_17235 [Blastocatellia bacterium]|nr:hypothetical protein [Blastocatellia bacterium]
MSGQGVRWTWPEPANLPGRLKGAFTANRPNDLAHWLEITAAEAKASSVIETNTVERQFEKAGLFHTFADEWLNDLNNSAGVTPERRDSRSDSHPLANC